MFKKIVSALFLGLVITTLFATYQSATAADRLGAEVLRLHILANSDSQEDQALKLKVRDAVLSYAGDLFGATQSKEQAVAQAWSVLGQLEEVAEQTLRENGCEYQVKASIERVFFPTREYGEGNRLPAGFYDALRLEIGRAQGRNWWCILYPPLCLGTGIEPAAQTDAVTRYQIKFKLVEWWQSLVCLFAK